MLSKADMQKAQAYPGRYVEHFCYCHSLSDKIPVLCTVSVVPLCSGRFIILFLKRIVSSAEHCFHITALPAAWD